MYIDTHAHLDFKQFEDLATHIKNWEHEEMILIVANGLNVKSNKRVKNISKKYELIKPAYGFHPVDILEHDVEKIRKEIKRIKDSDCIAFGEVGLDYKYAKTLKEQEKQKEIFLEFIKISKETGKPLIIHSRKAERDVIDMLKKANHTNAILHCFSGKKKYMQEASDFGLWFSAPSISDRGQQFKDMTKYVPMQQILTETDSPYLSPYEEKHNDPTTVKRTIKWLSKIKNESETTIKHQIIKNAEKVFNIKIKNS